MPLLQLRPYGRLRHVLHSHELLDGQNLARDVWRVSVVDCLQASMDAKRGKGVLDVGREGNGRTAKGDAEVSEWLGRRRR